MMILLIIVYRLVLECALRDLQIQIKKRGGEGIMIWDLCLCSKGTADGRSLGYHNHLQRLFKMDRLWKSKFSQGKNTALQELRSCKEPSYSEMICNGTTTAKRRTPMRHFN